MKDPIFIFSAGWRSGSTMLQRLITASGETLIWGESGGALNRFADAIECYKQMLGSGDEKYKYGYGGEGAAQYKELIKKGKGIIHSWIACLNPPEGVFLDAFRSLFGKVYVQPALQLGYSNWGLKEVQADIETADFLRLLYPNSKFVFLVRNPVNCLTSIKRRKWMDCPDSANPVEFFADCWCRLAKGFKDADFGYYAKYEDLINSPVIIDELSDYLEISSLPKDFIKTSKTDWNPENMEKLTYFERRHLYKIAGSEMERAGYR